MKKLISKTFLLLIISIFQYTALAQDKNEIIELNNNVKVQTLCFISDESISKAISIDYFNITQKIFAYGNIKIYKKPVFKETTEIRLNDIFERIDFLDTWLSRKTQVYEREGMLALGLIGLGALDLQKSREHEDWRNILDGIFLGSGVLFELAWMDAMIFSSGRLTERDSLYNEVYKLVQIHSENISYNGLLQIRTVRKRLGEKHDRGAIIFPNLNRELRKFSDEDTFIEQLLLIMNELQGSDPLLAALKDEYWKIRMVAARILGDQKILAARSALVDLFHNDKNQEVREQTAEALLGISEEFSLDKEADEQNLLAEVKGYKNKLDQQRWESKKINEVGGLGVSYGQFMAGSPEFFYNVSSFPEITFHLYGFNSYDSPKMGMLSFSIGKHSVQDQGKFIIDGKRVDTTFTVSYSFMTIGFDLMYRWHSTYFWPFVGGGIVVPIQVENHSIWGDASAGGMGVEFLCGMIIPCGRRITIHAIGKYMTKAYYYGKYHDPIQNVYWTESGWVDTDGFHINLGINLRLFN